MARCRSIHWSGKEPLDGRVTSKPCGNSINFPQKLVPPEYLDSLVNYGTKIKFIFT